MPNAERVVVASTGEAARMAIEDKDIYWKSNENDMETIDELDERIEEMKKYLINLEEKDIAIVSHSSILGQLKDNYIPLIENGDEELKYCHPYHFKLESK